MEKNIIEEAKAYINNLFNDNADGHDAEHSIRVYQNALKIAESYPDSDITIISLASLLHDVDDHKLFNTENNLNARNFLKSQFSFDLHRNNSFFFLGKRSDQIAESEDLHDCILR